MAEDEPLQGFSTGMVCPWNFWVVGNGKIRRRAWKGTVEWSKVVLGLEFRGGQVQGGWNVFDKLEAKSVRPVKRSNVVVVYGK